MFSPPGVGGRVGRQRWRQNMFSSAVANSGQTLDYVCLNDKKKRKQGHWRPRRRLFRDQLSSPKVLLLICNPPTHTPLHSAPHPRYEILMRFKSFTLENTAAPRTWKNRDKQISSQAGIKVHGNLCLTSGHNNPSAELAFSLCLSLFFFPAVHFISSCRRHI